MSEPKVTLRMLMDAMQSRPSSPDLELAVVEFMDLSDAEQKNMIFRELCYQGGQINWLLAQLRK